MIRDHISINQPHSIYPDKLKVAAAKDETTGDSAAMYQFANFWWPSIQGELRQALKTFADYRRIAAADQTVLSVMLSVTVMCGDQECWG